MWRNLGLLHGRDAVPISPYAYEAGEFMVYFDLTKDGRSFERAVRHPTLTGTVQLDLQWDKPLPANVVVLTLSTFHAMVTVDKARAVYYKFLA